MAKQASLTSELKVLNDAAFERSQLGRTSGDQQIASTLRSNGMAVDLNSSTAQVLRFNQALGETKSVAESALTGFLSDLRNGVSASDALTNALNKVVDKLMEMAANQVLSSLLGGLTGGSGGGLLGGLLGLGGGGTVGATTGATYVAGSHGGGVPGAGEASFYRMDHPALYAGAPRYHAGRDPFGLLAGEERAIIKRDEGVFTPAQMRAMGLQMAAARQASAPVSVTTPPTQVAFHGAPAGTQAEERDDGNGGRRLDVFFDEQVAASVRKRGSATQKAMGGLGARPVLVRR